MKQFSFILSDSLSQTVKYMSKQASIELYISQNESLMSTIICNSIAFFFFFSMHLQQWEVEKDSSM